MASGSAIRRSLDRHTWIALGSVVVLGGGLSLWAAFTDVAGAVIAHGVVAVEGGPKRVQHQEGGTVAEILVKNEDLVAAGQVLLRLDGTTTAANLAIINSQLAEALALEARLKAESTGASEMTAPGDALVSAELVIVSPDVV